MVGWFTRHTSWGRAVTEETLTAAVDQGLGTLTECAAALRELAEGRHGKTDSPRRLLAMPNGPWWAAVQAKRAVAAAAAAARMPRCKVRGHERQPVADCALCAGEAKAGGVDEPAEPTAELLAKGETLLPAAVRQRRSRSPQRESVAS